MIELTEEQLWILRAICIAGEKGIAEDSLEKLADEFSPDVTDFIGESIEALEGLNLIWCEWKIASGERRTVKYRHCFIGGAKTSIALADIPENPEADEPSD